MKQMNTKSEPTFKTVVCGKWILAGEHAVLRGHPAIIFPVKNKELIFSYWPSDDEKKEVRAEFSGEFGDEMQFLFWSVLERALEILNIQHRQLTGKIFIENNVPVGVGMGSSATVSVALARWLVHLKFIPEATLFEFARQLENLFHGESSGADIAVAIAGAPICFSRSGAMRPIKLAWQPQWYLSYSGKSSTTLRSVKKVKEMWERAPDEAKKIDEMMAQCVALAEKALQTPFPNQDEHDEEDQKDMTKNSFKLLEQAILLGHQCFKCWNLCDAILEKHIQELRDNGAMAAKPTGAGDGGFVISLWNKKPPESLMETLIGV